MKKNYDIIIVGAGISGLHCAHVLEQECAHQQKLREAHSPQLLLLEASHRVGGKISTQYVSLPSSPHPCILEEGPDAVLAGRPEFTKLLQELNLQSEQIHSEEKRKIWVYTRGRRYALPDGMVLVVPTKILPFACSPLLSWKGKLRAACEVFIPRAKQEKDESLASFIKRRFGSEVLYTIGEPLLSGIFSADPERQSMASCFPRLKEMEARSGSLIRGFLSSMKGAAKNSNNKKQGASFESFKQGMQGLAHAIAAKLRAPIYFQKQVRSLEVLQGSNNTQDILLHLLSGESLQTKHLVLTVPPEHASQIFSSYSAELAEELASIRLLDTANVHLLYRRADAPKMPQGSGLIAPQGEFSIINSISFSSQKFTGRCAEDYLLLRCSIGGSRQPEVLRKTDEHILEAVLKDIKASLQISAKPMLTHIKRWPKTVPQYDLGHQEKIARIDALLPKGVFLIGHAYRGAGIPDCVAYSGKIAKLLAKQWQDETPSAILENAQAMNFPS